VLVIHGKGNAEDIADVLEYGDSLSVRESPEADMIIMRCRGDQGPTGIHGDVIDDVRMT
jgi:hypothetical protein